MASVRGLAGMVLGVLGAVATSEAAIQCGLPGTESCCFASTTPFCEDQRCCVLVCGIDPFCCQIAWDALCSNLANSICEGCGDVCGGQSAGSCCRTSSVAGCSDPECCSQICAIDAFCCKVVWDQGCAALASDACDVCQFPSCPSDLNGDGVVGGADLAILLGSWGGCPKAAPCAADLNGDGVVNGADLGVLLGAWGQCP